jgi:probable HAF family extracellular repeat protein
MSALPTVGGNNGQASAINNRGEVAGYAETSVIDSGCPPFKITSAVLWEKGKALALPTVSGDLDGVAFSINNHGQTVGYSGSCVAATHAVMWKNNTAFVLQDLGGTRSNIAYVINNRGQIAGKVRSADDTHYVAALWQPDGTLTTHEPLPGDLDAFATGINNRGQVVGNDFDSSFNWSHGFIWQNSVMTDLNTLIPADSNLLVISASSINDRGQISGMATVLTGPHTGNIHAYLATPVDATLGKSIADVARTLPKITLPANVGKQTLQNSAHCRLER